MVKSTILYPIFLFIVSILTYNTVFSKSDESNHTPYDVVYNHYHYLEKNTYDELKAAESFNLKSRKERIKSAKLLNEIIYAKGLDLKSIVNKIPDDPDYIDSTRRRQIYILYSKLPQVYVEKVDDNWYYSKETVGALSELHKKIFPFGANIWAKWFSFDKNEKWFKLYPWQWIGLCIILVSFIICFFLLKYLFRFIFYRFLFKKYVNEIQDLNQIKFVSNLFSVWIGVKILQIFIPTLFINPVYALPIIRGVDLAAAILIVLVIYKLAEIIIFYLKKYTQSTTSKWDDQFVVVFQKFLKFIIAFIGLFYILNTQDVNIATIIAGLSVGGLALALAAQDTVKNFIASVMIFIDKPFKIGDTIKGDNFEGAVLEVGFRSTRIKTADDSIVYVANAKLSEMIIDNKGNKSYKKFKTEISVSYDTPLENVERFIEGIRTILLQHPHTKNSKIDVRLTTINEKGLTITIGYSYKSLFPKEELQYREVILMSILKLAELLHIRLFEQQQHIVFEQKSKDGINQSSDDVEHQLQRFFAEFNTKVSDHKLPE